MPLGDGWRESNCRSPIAGDGAPAPPPPPPDAASGLTPGNGRLEVENFVPTGLRCLEVICWPMPIRTSYRLLLPALLSERASESSDARLADCSPTDDSSDASDAMELTSNSCSEPTE